MVSEVEEKAKGRWEMNALVSVIVPLYNKAQTVERALNSIFAQTYTNMEVIVVNDGSTDGCDMLVRRKFDDARLVVIDQANQGPGAARNAGIRAAKGDYIAFLDADDSWYPQNLETMINWLQSHKDCAMVGCMYFEWSKQTYMSGHWAKRGVVPGVYRLEAGMDAVKAESLILFFRVCNSVLRAETAKNYGGFYENRCISGEDTVFFMRIMANEMFGIIPDVGECHHCEAAGLSNKTLPQIAPMLTDRRIVLDYCPKDMLPLFERIFARLALRAARHKARAGYGSVAKILINDYPEAKEFGFEYYRCLYEICFCKVFKYWTAFKRLTGPRSRRFVGQYLNRRDNGR